MNLQINAHNLELNNRIESYVAKKTERLDRYMPNLAEVRVDLSSQNARNAAERQIAQVTIRDNHGTYLRAEERSSDIFAALDGVVDKLHRQIGRYRGKKRSQRRGHAEDFVDAEPMPDEYDDELDGESTIVRRKRFSLQPMSPDEAIDQMELLSHDFFVFFNSEEESVNVVYRRHDTTYGLLHPGL